MFFSQYTQNFYHYHPYCVCIKNNTEVVCFSNWYSWRILLLSSDLRTEKLKNPKYIQSVPSIYFNSLKNSDRISRLKSRWFIANAWSWLCLEKSWRVLVVKSFVYPPYTHDTRRPPCVVMKKYFQVKSSCFLSKSSSKHYNARVMIIMFYQS